MKLVNTIFIIAIAMALVMASTAAAPANVEEEEEEGEVNFIEADPTVSYQPSLRTTSRFLAQKNPKSIKCNKNPSVCLSQGSLGPHCCHNKCVDLTTDDHNCGRCGNKCKFTTKCCRGQCVWLAYDKRHCGRCNHRCPARDICLFGMCSYA